MVTLIQEDTVFFQFIRRDDLFWIPLKDDKKRGSTHHFQSTSKLDIIFEPLNVVISPEMETLLVQEFSILS